MKDGTKIVFENRGVLTVIRYGKTSNKKISPKGEAIVQTYHFSRAQYDYARSGAKGYQGLMAGELTEANCNDCPYRFPDPATLAAQCYTHKPIQASGFLSMLRSIVRTHPDWTDIPHVSEVSFQGIADMCRDRYVRFGSYGEPINLPMLLLAGMAVVSSSYTGYTHQWRNPLYGAYKRFFMASTDSGNVGQASASGWREFSVTGNEDDDTGFIGCPASKEGGYRSNCAKCGLCSGTTGKGSRSVVIEIH